MRKKLLKAAIALTVVFFAVSAVWFAWSRGKYSVFVGNLEKNEEVKTFLTPRYIGTDDEGFDYGVKYPDYLTLTGNLSVGMPTDGEDMYTDALIIWPKLDGTYEYGALLYDEEGSYQIEIDREGNALNAENNEVIKRHIENIRVLLNKAEMMWKCD